MAISVRDLEHLAQLSRLELSGAEKNMYTEQLNVILGYIEKLKEVDTTDVPPTVYVLPMHNILREDEERPSMDREKVLQNAPHREDGQFRVPKIV